MKTARSIDEKDRELLLDLSMSASTGWDILVASGHSALKTKVEQLFSDDERITVISANGGGKILLECARISPDLLILDDTPTDFSLQAMIETMKADENLSDMAILCGISSAAMDDVPGWGADDYFVLKNLDDVYLKRKITSLIFLTDADQNDSADQKKTHDRAAPRTKLNLSASIEMVCLKGSNKTEIGEAHIEDISSSGALLSDIKLEQGGIPLEPYHIRLKINEPPLHNWTADSVVVRMKDFGSAGVKFLDISKQDQKKIDNLLHKK